MRNKPVQLVDIAIEPGEQKAIEISLATTTTHNDLKMTAHAMHEQPTRSFLFVCVTIHGDEINGVEIIRCLLGQKQIQQIRGTLITIPIVNMHGFISHSCYLPDGYDLNRSFPGSNKGSLAGHALPILFSTRL